jgi:hypothetical protein
MLSQARSMQRWRWLSIGENNEPVQLKRQVQQIAGPDPSPDRVMAAVHAVHRALGAV